MSHPASKYIVTHEGPMAVVKACTLCKFYHKRPKGLREGRGAGMKYGNKSRGILIQHIKSEHPEVLK